MSTDVLEGLDAPESEIGQEQPPPPELQVDPAPEPDKQPERDEAGKFKGKAGEKQDAKPDKAAPKDEPRTIPLAEHLQERNKHRSEIEQERAARKALEERLAKLENPPKKPEPEPDFTADPKAYVDTKLGAALKQLETGTAEAKKTSEQAQQEATFTRFQHQLNFTEQQFVGQNPDYYDSLTHLRELRFQELQILNPGVEPQQIIDAIKREEMQLAWQHLNAGRNPHELAYQLAKARGYQPKSAAKPNGEGAPALPNVPGPRQLPPDQTLGTGSGSPNAGETFLNDDEVFEKAFSEMFGRRKSA